MRKQYLILAAACLTIGITACGNSSTQSTTAQTSAETEASQDATEGTERTDETETEGSSAAEETEEAAEKTVTGRVDGIDGTVLSISGQNDIVAHPEYSGFESYIEHFRGKPRVAICELTHNYRGWVSRWADELDTDEMRLLARRKKKQQEKKEQEREILLDSIETSEDEEDID